MICWDRLGNDVVIGVLEADEPAGLRDLFTWARDLLNARIPDRAGSRTDPALRAILAMRGGREHGEPPHWADAEVFDTSHAMLELALTTIPDEGTVVLLPSFNHVFAWLWALTDLSAARTQDAPWLTDIATSLQATASAERAQRVDHLW